MNPQDQKLSSLSSEKRQLLELLLKQRQGKKQEYTNFALLDGSDKRKLPDDIEDAFPIGNVQLGMLYHMEAKQQTNVPADYHNVATFILSLDDTFEIKQLQSAVDRFVSQEPTFRTSFHVTGFKEPLQLVHKKAHLTISYEDLRHASPTVQEEKIDLWIESENHCPIAIDEAPLIRLHVHHLSDSRIAFSLTEPHAISDGWSTHLNMLDIFNMYTALKEGCEIPTAEPSSKYVEFIIKEREILDSKDAKSFWREVICNHCPTELPLKAPTDDVSTLGSHRHDEPLPDHVLTKLNWLVRETGLPMKSLLLAAHARLISLLSGSKKITTGLNFNGRLGNRDGINTRGMFLNILPINVSLEAESWIDLARHVHEMETRVLPYRQYPLAAVQSAFGNQAMFTTAFSFLHFHSLSDSSLFSGKINCEKVIDFSKTNFDFNSVFNLHAGSPPSLEHKHDANLSRFTLTQLKSYYEIYKQILEDLASNPLSDPKRLSFLPEMLKTKLVYDFNDTVKPYPKKTIDAWFSESVERFSERRAVDCAITGEALTYRQLNERANVLAGGLTSLGLGSGDKIGVMQQHAPAVIVSILAILKAGAAFVPLEPKAPLHRNRKIIEISQAKYCLGIGNSPEGLEDIWLDVSDLKSDHDHMVTPVGNSDPESPCYVIFTSGSTGLPKGVVVTHRSVANYLSWAIETYGVKPKDIMPLFTPLSFDLTITSLFAPLLSGAQVRTFPQKGVISLLSQIQADQSLSLIKMTPAHLQILSQMPLEDWSVSRLIVGGEQLGTELARRVTDSAKKHIKIFNEYGPTEATVGCMAHEYEPSAGSGAVPIGKPAPNVRLYVLDEMGHPVIDGAKGELHIAGDCLALGYLNEEDDSPKSFIDDPFFSGQIMYRTGDRVLRNHNGNLEYIGRSDNQVKLRGYRIEVGEVESVLAEMDVVQQATVVVKEINDSPELAAFLVLSDGCQYGSSAEIQQYIRDIKVRLRKRLPAYMVPSYFALIGSMPLTSNGKVDVNALVEKYEVQSEKADHIEPSNDIEQALLSIWRNVFGREEISVADNFFDIGGNSLLSYQLVMKLRSKGGFDVEPVDVFEYPSIRSMAEHISTQRSLDDTDEWRGNEVLSTRPISDETIAIIGMAGRFPDAESIDQFWENIANEVESLNGYSDEELLAEGVDNVLLSNKNYIKSGTFLEGIREFDADYFGFTPREVQLMDPQQRILLEVAVEALDDAGYGNHAIAKKSGVFISVGEAFYFINNLLSNKELLLQLGMETQLGNGRDFVATRLSHRLNLTGPAMTIATACSSSLVAIHEAIGSLRQGESEIALAGGCKVGQFGPAGHLYQEGGILSKDGRCRTFDANASGTRSGDGCGLIVLKLLTAAIDDGDHIYGLIKGSAVNNDGQRKAGYTAPSVQGQVGVINSALQNAGLEASEIQYVEAHGTATQLGDPIEIRALKKVFGRGEVKSVAVGSVKPNIGHLDAAAGVAGVVKSVMALKHATLPPSINVQTINPAIDLEGSPLFVNTVCQPWRNEGKPRRAGVSSFGIGGTNAHVVLEEAPEKNPVAGSGEAQLVTLSGRTQKALNDVKTRLLERLKGYDEFRLEDIAFTLAVGRNHHSLRETYVVADQSGLIAALEVSQKNSCWADDSPAVIYMFPGQGNQYQGACRGLYELNPEFRKYFDECATLFEEYEICDLRKLAIESANENDLPRINEPDAAQAIMFSTSWSVARVFIDLGVKPQAMIGHSIGEIVAATLSGVMSLEQAVRLIATRARLMKSCEPGKMFAVALSVEDLEPILETTGAELAAINGAEMSVVSVPLSRAKRLVAELDGVDANYKQLQTTHAYHSAMMEPAAQKLREEIADMQWSTPKIPFASNVTGRIFENDRCFAQYWADHMRGTVRFHDGLQALVGTIPSQSIVLCEVGIGESLSSLGRKIASSADLQVISTIGRPDDQRLDHIKVLKSVGKMWKVGLPVLLHKLFEGRKCSRVSLPSYPFERKEYWINPQQSDPKRDSKASAAPSQGGGFYEVHWKLRLSSALSSKKYKDKRWLIVGDDDVVCQGIINALKCADAEFNLVVHGSAFASLETHFTAAPTASADFAQVLEALNESGQLPDIIVHSGGLIPCETSTAQESFHWAEENGFISAVNLFKALGESYGSVDVKAVLLGMDTWRVRGDESIRSYSAAKYALAIVASQEYPHLRCHFADLSETAFNSATLPGLEKILLDECSSNEQPFQVAFRGTQRWVPEYYPARMDAVSDLRISTAGSYVITGGLGNIGLALAESLTERYGAKVALISRHSLPDDEQSKEIDMLDVAPHRLTKRQRILRLKEKGAKVMIVNADVSDCDALEAAFVKVEQSLGGISGVIHAAGQVQDAVSPISLSTQDAFRDQCMPKVFGVMALDKVLQDRSVDFVLLMSSLSSVLGGLGFAAYAAANSYMDSFVDGKLNGGDNRWKSVNWDGWSFEKATEERGDRYEIRGQDGVDAVYEALATDNLNRSIYVAADFEKRLDKWVNDVDAEFEITSSNDRPEMEVEYIEPSSDLERRLCKIWQQLLGINQIGVNDSFFELGGDSLLITRVIVAVRQEFRVAEDTMSIQQFFMDPTISTLARFILMQGDDVRNRRDEIREAGKEIEEGEI